jgi:outer membrane protein
MKYLNFRTAEFAVFVLALSFVATCTFAQEPASSGTAAVPPAPRIVTISFNAAVMQTAEAQRQFGTLQAGFASRQAKLQALAQEVDSLRKQGADTATRLTDAEKAAKGQSLAVKEKELERQGEDYRTDAESASQQAFQEVAEKVFTFLQEYARQHAFAMVVERGMETAPAVWYAAGDVDITDPVVKAYNASSAAGSTEKPGGAGGASAPKPSASLPTAPRSH